MCRFVQVPAGGLLLNRDEVRFTFGAHHVLVYETGYREIPTENDFGEPVPTDDVFDCTAGPTHGWDIRGMLGGRSLRKESRPLTFRTAWPFQSSRKPS